MIRVRGGVREKVGGPIGSDSAGLSSEIRRVFA